ncbi:hypothetical protein KIN20_014077 [Parelaphostrongylus tenuis]|uniref:Uncharacterized protein n=1 Tax=Parelaphostrongylus tenuis TaxID=148309 RepID=A0AAD5MHS0_PARTN|nr:hypothetical protein KIN20_014077 [Parelaphostrongylus tenuis]
MKKRKTSNNSRCSSQGEDFRWMMDAKKRINSREFPTQFRNAPPTDCRCCLKIIRISEQF